MTTIRCVVCGHQLVVPSIDGVELRWSSIVCNNCSSTLAVHVTVDHIYVKLITATKQRTQEDQKLFEEMLVI
jgi:transcription elongation factor Elf1